MDGEENKKCFEFASSLSAEWPIVPTLLIWCLPLH